MDVQGTHNNPLVLSMDAVLRGGISDPSVALAGHEAEWSAWLAGSGRETRFTSSQMCGSCHDVVTPAGLELERTYREWQDTVFAQSASGGVLPDLNSRGCVDCHMGPLTKGSAATVDGASENRILHPHDFAGIDVHLTEFPDAMRAPQVKKEQADAMEKLRGGALCSAMCVKEQADGRYEVKVWLHNESVGHSWPSGAVHARRAWVEVIADDANRQVFSSGLVGDAEPVVKDLDADLWLFHGTLLDDEGHEVYMPWKAATLEAVQLPMTGTLDGDSATWRSRSYDFETSDLARVQSRVRIRPLARTIVDELVGQGVLDSAIYARLTTHELSGSELEWTPNDGATFCSSGEVDCGNEGSCVTPRREDSFVFNCLPPELQPD